MTPEHTDTDTDTDINTDIDRDGDTDTGRDGEIDRPTPSEQVPPRSSAAGHEPPTPKRDRPAPATIVGHGDDLDREGTPPQGATGRTAGARTAEMPNRADWFQDRVSAE
jgi:hypothetical protein